MQSEVSRSDEVEREFRGVEVLVELREAVVLLVELLRELSPETGLLLLDSVSDVRAISIVRADDVRVESAGNRRGVANPAGEGKHDTHESPQVSVATVLSACLTRDHVRDDVRSREAENRNVRLTVHAHFPQVLELEKTLRTQLLVQQAVHNAVVVFV